MGPIASEKCRLRANKVLGKYGDSGRVFRRSAKQIWIFLADGISSVGEKPSWRSQKTREVIQIHPNVTNPYMRAASLLPDRNRRSPVQPQKGDFRPAYISSVAEIFGPYGRPILF